MQQDSAYQFLGKGRKAIDGLDEDKAAALIMAARETVLS